MSHAYWDDTGWGVPPSVDDFSGHQAVMRRAYYGCLSYTDAVLGRLLAALDGSAAATHTATVFMGDRMPVRGSNSGTIKRARDLLLRRLGLGSGADGWQCAPDELERGTHAGSSATRLLTRAGPASAQPRRA